MYILYLTEKIKDHIYETFNIKVIEEYKKSDGERFITPAIIYYKDSANIIFEIMWWRWKISLCWILDR
jgi:hypothetical protein